MTSIRRHLEGWQLAVVAVGMALLSAVLVLPRTVAPREVPMPWVDRREQTRAELAARERVELATRRPLPFAVRALGETIRKFGKAEADGDGAEADALAAAVAARATEVRKRHGDEALLTLRAVQSELFTRAVASGAPADVLDADELGGSFRRRARDNGWIGPDGRCSIPGDQVGVIFSVRWTKLTGLLETFPFSPSLNEWRLYFRTLLSHPEAKDGVRSMKADAETQLQVVKALARRDPDYPELLARGILEHRRGNFVDASELLSAHLREHPDGPWRLRAQNYLLAAYRHVRSPR